MFSRVTGSFRAHRYAPDVPALLLRFAIALAVLGLVSACTADDVADTPRPPPPDLTLLPTGLGSYDVGLPAQQVIDGISAEIGGWDADSADRDDTIPIPDCGFDDVRIVTWGNLVLVFAGEGQDDPFFTWSYGFDPVTGNAEDIRRLGLVTDLGVGLGTPRPDVERIYRGRLAIDDDEVIDVAAFTIDGDEEEHLAGLFPTTAPAASLQYLERVPACTFAGG